MKIAFVEIQNFRKLESVRIDFAQETTLLVGANNSGKTSAMVALRHFLINRNKFTINDFTLSKWIEIDQMGMGWLGAAGRKEVPALTFTDWQSLVPTMDLWLQVEENEIHRVQHILPTLSWTNGLLGIRLCYQPKKLLELFAEFTEATTVSLATKASAEELKTGDEKYEVKLWPETMRDFLTRRLKSHFEVRCFILDPTKSELPVQGIARPQALSEDIEPLEGDPLRGLVRIDQVPAQRGFADVSTEHDEDDANTAIDKISLSKQLIRYYKKHLDPTEAPEVADLDALDSMEKARNVFNERLQKSFEESMVEMESLNYPGVNDPRARPTGNRRNNTLSNVYGKRSRHRCWPPLQPTS